MVFFGFFSYFIFQNQIKKIENLESFPNLRYSSSCSQRFISMGKGIKIPTFGIPSTSPVPSRFLCLAGNRIQKVENLQALPHLSLLDLSHNLIQVLDTGGKQKRIQG